MTSPVDQLAKYRASIDNLDAILLHTLAERFKITQAVGKLKAENDMPPSDKAREARQIERLQMLAEDSGLDPIFAEKFLNFIVAEVIRHPNTTVEIKDEKAAAKVLGFLEDLEEHDDVQKISANFDIPDDVISKLDS